MSKYQINIIIQLKCSFSDMKYIKSNCYNASILKLLQI